MSPNLRELESRIESLEDNHAKVNELVDLLDDVKGALRIFVKIGYAVKWIAICVTTVSAAGIAVKKWIA